MKFDDLLDLTLREVLENYSALMSLECAYYYGVASDEDIDRMYDEYNIEEEYSEAMYVESIVPYDLLDKEEVIDYDKIVRIMDNLGITKKKKSEKE